MAPSKSEPRLLTLTVLSGPSTGECLSKPGAANLKFGRVKTGNTFAIKCPSISSKHAEFVWDDSEAAAGGTWFLVDMGSSNGTNLNGNSMCLTGQRYPLRDGDIINFGPDTKVQVGIEASEEDAASLTVEQKLTADAQRIAASIKAAADAMVDQIRAEWREQRAELEALLVN